MQKYSYLIKHLKKNIFQTGYGIYNNLKIRSGLETMGKNCITKNLLQYTIFLFLTI